MVESTETVKRGVRRRCDGRVVSVSGRKTVVVEVATRRKHPEYGKVVRVLNRFHAHDEAETAKPGDGVRIEETRPLSKMKCWRVIDIRERAVVV